MQQIYELAQLKTTDKAISDATSHIQKEMVQLLKFKGILSLNFRGHLSEDILADMKHLLEKMDSHNIDPKS